MSFFYFKAGYFNKTLQGDTRYFILDKARRLMVPYAIWGLVGCLIFFSFIFLILPEGNAHVRYLSISHLWTTSCVWGNGPLWFLMSFFLMYVVAHLISKMPNIKLLGRCMPPESIVIFFPFVSMGLAYFHNPLPLHLNNVFFAVYLFFLGKYWRQILDKLGRRRSLLASMALLVVFAALVFAFGFTQTIRSNAWHGNPLLVLVVVTTSTCGLSGLLLSLDFKRVPVICFLGEHSMVYFVTHRLVTTVFEMIREYQHIPQKDNMIDALVLIVLCFVICSLLVKPVEKVPC